MGHKRQPFGRTSRRAIHLSCHPVWRTLVLVPRWRGPTSSVQKQSSTRLCFVYIVICWIRYPSHNCRQTLPSLATAASSIWA